MDEAHKWTGRQDNRRPDVDALLLHAQKFYSDHSIAKDLDCLIAGSSAAVADCLRAYARARRQAPGFRPHDSKANSHDRIRPEDWTTVERLRREALDAAATAARRQVDCASCGRTFGAMRTTARFCTATCRKRASRGHANDPRNRGRGGMSHQRQTADLTPCDSGANKSLSVTFSGVPHAH